MKQTKKWVENLLERLEEKGPVINGYFDELVYGKAMTCLCKGNRSQIILYLNEDVPEMLVGAVKYERQVYLNLRETQIIVNSSKHEVELKLAPNIYILLKNENEEIILLFEGTTPAEKKQQSLQKSLFLQFFKFYVEQLKQSPFQIESLLLTTFLSVDKNQNMTLEESEVKFLLKKIKLKKNEEFESIVNFIRKEEQIKEGEITFTEFEKIMKLMQCKQQFKSLFEDLAVRKIKSYKYYMQKMLPINKFIEFLRDVQLQSPQVIKKIEGQFASIKIISFYDFSRFMVSKYTNIYDATLENNLQNMKNPLTNYFCFSSHNTYLTGNQFTSDSKAERYRDDLENGYRCLEIDVHDGDNEPIVKHGYTMTSSITFAEVINAVAKFSNENPQHTPIILSLQNHAGEEQQQQMANMLKKAFGQKILNILIHINSKTYPTLEETIGKIIIKNSGTFLQYQLVADEGDGVCIVDEGGGSSQDEDDDNLPQTPLIKENIEQYPSQFQDHIKQFNEIQKNLEKERQQFLKSKRLFKRFISRRSSSLAVKQIKKNISPQLLKSVSMLGKGSLKKPCIWESVSLSENSVNKYFANDFPFLKNMTDKYWVRSYPSASRVDSSNYNPITALQLGIQLVAINSQFTDHYAAVMKTFFRKNRNTCRGYRLKDNNESLTTKQVKIRPISCCLISSLVNSSSIPDVQVKMSFLGAAQDMDLNKSHAKMEAFTERIKDNAYNPIFRDANVMHLKITRPEFAFILLEIENCGIGVISIEGLKKGYRYAPLLDNSLQERKSKIFFKVD